MDNIELIKRKAVNIYSEEDLEKKLKSGKKLIVKFGADPSRPDLHIGHTVPLRVLRQFQDMGHEVVFLIGDFTAMIGDPSGKSKTRPALTFEETRKSAESYMEQATKILDPKKTKIRYNSEWYSKMSFEEVIKLLSHYTVARIMERDDFKNRFENNLPLSMHELLYPLMQGYDSVALESDIEIGGTDQTFNVLVGREIQKDYGQEQQVVMTFPLLVGLDGKEKMSKSLGNYIGISEEPFVKLEKAMKIPDECLRQYYELATDMPIEEINEIMAGDIREAHFRFAKELLKMYDDVNEFEDLKARYLDIAKGGTPDDVPELKVEGAEIGLTDAMVNAGFVPSKAEAKRMIKGNGVKVNGKVVSDVQLTLDPKENPVIQVGKNKFIKLV